MLIRCKNKITELRKITSLDVYFSSSCVKIRIKFTFRELIYTYFYNVKRPHVFPGSVQELYFFATLYLVAIVCAPVCRAYLSRAVFRDSVCRHRDVAHDKSVPVYRVTQYFRGRLANKRCG